MKRSFLNAFLFTAAMALPAQAIDIEQMSDSEREAFRAEIRAYLLENPEVIMEAVAVLEERQADAQSQDEMELVRVNSEAIFNDGHSFVGGNPEGDITLVEFMDYRCGYCRRAVDEVHSLLTNDGNIRFIIKEFPILGHESTLASRFAIATKQVNGDEAYISMHDALMAFTGTITKPTLSRLADSLGLDPAAIIDHMDSEEVSEVIAENHALAQRLSISGTPSFVMANQMLRGYVPAEAMQRLADEIRTQ